MIDDTGCCSFTAAQRLVWLAGCAQAVRRFLRHLHFYYICIYIL